MEVIDFEARNTLALERFQPKRSTLHGARFTRDNASASGLSARLTRPNWLSSFTFCERRSQLPDLPGPVLSVEERVVEIVRFQRIRIVHHDFKPRGTCPENCSLQKHRQSPNDMSPTDEARFLALRERRPGLVRDGLATVVASTVKAGSRTVQVTRVRITDAGRRALEDDALCRS